MHAATLVIDSHAHIAWRPLYDPRFLRGLVRPLLSGLERSAGTGARERAERLVDGFFSDRWGDRLVEQMDRAGIARTVLLMIPILNTGQREGMTAEEVYAHHRAVQQRHPHRLLVFAGVDPRGGENDLQLFTKAVRDWGFRGMKLYPPLGYAADCGSLDGYYELCRDNGLAVVVHTGPSLPEMQNSLADVGRVAAAARRWPEINFILAHAGYLLESDAVALAHACPNVYLDMSAFQSRYARADARAARELGRVFGDPLCDKVLFGTDWPLFNLLTGPARNLQLVRDVFRLTPLGGDESRLERVLAGNARRLLGLGD